MRIKSYTYIAGIVTSSIYPTAHKTSIPHAPVLCTVQYIYTHTPSPHQLCVC